MCSMSMQSSVHKLSGACLPTSSAQCKRPGSAERQEGVSANRRRTEAERHGTRTLSEWVTNTRYATQVARLEQKHREAKGALDEELRAFEVCERKPAVSRHAMFVTICE